MIAQFAAENQVSHPHSPCAAPSLQQRQSCSMLMSAIPPPRIRARPGAPTCQSRDSPCAAHSLQQRPYTLVLSAGLHPPAADLHLTIVPRLRSDWKILSRTTSSASTQR